MTAEEHLKQMVSGLIFQLCNANATIDDLMAKLKEYETAAAAKEK